MSRNIFSALSASGKKSLKFLGYNTETLPLVFLQAVELYVQNGAVKKVGEVKSVKILHRNDGSSPVHYSHFDPTDKELIVSTRITPADGRRARTHHIYSDGTGTIKKGDKREYSTSSDVTVKWYKFPLDRAGGGSEV